MPLTSGREKRNARFSQSRRHYDAGTGVRSLADLYDMLAFFEARRGSLHAFRFRDPFDMKSCRPEEAVSAADQVLGTGDGSKARFSLAKTYGEGEDAYQRLIAKPVLESLRVAVGGVEKTSPADLSFDFATGEVVFAPGSDSRLGRRGDGRIRVRCAGALRHRAHAMSLTAFKAGQIPSIPLIEVRL